MTAKKKTRKSSASKPHLALRSSPTLAAYVERIGAREVSPRKFDVPATDEPAYGHVRRSKATIRIRDGKITCSNKEFEPKTEEAAAIESELKDIRLPKSRPTGKLYVEQLKKQLGGKPTLFIYLSEDGNQVLWVQERRIGDDGEKRDLPWSFMDDISWQMQEPDTDLLPLFGIEQLKLHEGKSVVIHEGAKAAQFWQRLSNGIDWETRQQVAAHPWGEELASSIHLGWPGGALNPHRVDWTPVRNLPRDTRVTLVCDNDTVGKAAAPKISRLLMRPLRVLMFDDHFPGGFDLADSFPHPKDDSGNERWWRDGRYIGPPMRDFERSGTWATEVVHTSSRGRPAHRLRQEFAQEWVRSSNPEVVINLQRPHELLSIGAFNDQVRPYSDVGDTASLLSAAVHAKVDGVAYRPGKERSNRGRVINVDGARLFNTFRAPLIVPASVKGHDAKPWVDFIHHLIPDEHDEHEVLRWVATLIARPSIKMSYGMLLVSETQGVGKSTLGEAILAPLVGWENVSFPSEATLVESNFNGWLAHRRLAVVHEIYAGHSTKAYDKLKSAITESHIEVSRKYIENYVIENHVEVLAASNSLRAIKLDQEDRRWFVPIVTEEVLPPQYWREFHEWLKAGGLPIIAGWAEKFLETNPAVQRGEHAPDSARKREMIEESLSEGQRLARDLVLSLLEEARAVEGGAKKFVLAVEEMRHWVAHKRGMKISDQHLERSLTLRKALRRAGLLEPDRSGDLKEVRRFMVPNVGRTHVVANFKIPASAEWPDLEEHYLPRERWETM